jgi:hypothetical protein
MAALPQKTFDFVVHLNKVSLKPAASHPPVTVQIACRLTAVGNPAIENWLEPLMSSLRAVGMRQRSKDNTMKERRALKQSAEGTAFGRLLPVSLRAES